MKGNEASLASKHKLRFLMKTVPILSEFFFSVHCVDFKTGNQDLQFLCVFRIECEKARVMRMLISQETFE